MSEGERSLVVVQIISHKSRFAFWILIFDIFSASPRFGWEIYKIVPSRLTSRHTTHQTLLLLSFFVKYVITKIIHPRCFPYHFFFFSSDGFTSDWIWLKGKRDEKLLLPGSVVVVVVGAVVVSSANIDLTLNDVIEIKIMKRHNSKLLSVIVSEFFIPFTNELDEFILTDACTVGFIFSLFLLLLHIFCMLLCISSFYVNHKD